MKVSDVKVLIWDFDGTFYKPIPKLWHAIREAEYRTIMEANGWDHDRAVEEFNKLYKKVYPSATQTVGKLTGMTTTQAALKMEDFFDRRDFVKPDPKLAVLFKKLAHFRHFILANGVRAKIIETLEHWGLPTGTFEEIVTSELSGENKPSPAGFLYILNKTKLPPSQHLMIGDREIIDLEPAMKVGMKTYLVNWDGGKNVFEVEKALVS
jgi:FMN phosphatase YigB (HAD superfamily)